MSNNEFNAAWEKQQANEKRVRNAIPENAKDKLREKGVVAKFVKAVLNSGDPSVPNAYAQNFTNTEKQEFERKMKGDNTNTGSVASDPMTPPSTPPARRPPPPRYQQKSPSTLAPMKRPPPPRKELQISDNIVRELDAAIDEIAAYYEVYERYPQIAKQRNERENIAKLGLLMEKLQRILMEWVKTSSTQTRELLEAYEVYTKERATQKQDLSVEAYDAAMDILHQEYTKVLAQRQAALPPKPAGRNPRKTGGKRTRRRYHKKRSTRKI